MLVYSFRRFIQALVVLAIVSVLIFVLFRLLIPGDPAMVWLGLEFTEEAYQVLRAEMGLDRPVPIQYLVWVRDAVRLDFGNSAITGRSVNTMLGFAIPITFRIALSSVLLAFFISIFLGVFSALNSDTWFDHVVRSISIVGIALPIQWLGVLFILLFSIGLRWLPAGGYVGPDEDFGRFVQFSILPVFTAMISLVAVNVRFLRSSFLEVLVTDYMRTARSKGLSEWTVIFKHGLRNALSAMVTVVGMSLATLMGGLIIVERIFNVPGLGMMMVRAIGERDYPVIQATVLLSATLFVVISLLVDLSYGWLDPRVSYE